MLRSSRISGTDGAVLAAAMVAESQGGMLFSMPSLMATTMMKRVLEQLAAVDATSGESKCQWRSHRLVSGTEA